MYEGKIEYSKKSKRYYRFDTRSIYNGGTLVIREENGFWINLYFYPPPISNLTVVEGTCLLPASFVKITLVEHAFPCLLGDEEIDVIGELFGVPKYELDKQTRMKYNEI